jgi:hypothetical protein
MTRFGLLIATCCLLATAAAPAHDKPRPGKPDGRYTERVVPMRDFGAGYWDFRFGMGSEPMLTDAEYELNDGTSPDYDWEASGGSLEFNVAHRFRARGASSGYVTFGVFLRGFGGPDDPDRGNEVSVGSGGVQVGGGWSYRPNARYSLEVGPRIGLGTASATEEVCGGDEIESDTGGYARFDVGAANLFNVGTLQFGVNLGLASWAATVDYDPKSVNTCTGPAFFPGGEATYSGSGAYVTLSLGFR